MERVARAADRVNRTAGSWTPTVHRLLAHLHERGFVEAPEPIALGDELETVSFIPGRAGEDPWTDDVASEAALVTAARLLRNYHDAAATFVVDDSVSGAAPVARDDVWSQADRAPVETVCHGDFAPYNCIFDGRAAVGLIDFDTAHPGPRIWDVAAGVYRFAPFTTAAHRIVDLDVRLARAAEFCRVYGLEPGSREQLVDVMVAGLVALVTTIETEAAVGDDRFVQQRNARRADLYRADVAYIETHAASIRDATR